MGYYGRCGRIAVALDRARHLVDLLERSVDHPRLEQVDSALTDITQASDALLPLAKVLRAEQSERPEPPFIAPGTRWSSPPEAT